MIYYDYFYTILMFNSGKLVDKADGIITTRHPITVDTMPEVREEVLKKSIETNPNVHTIEFNSLNLLQKRETELASSFDVYIFYREGLWFWRINDDGVTHESKESFETKENACMDVADMIGKLLKKSEPTGIGE